MSDRTYTAEPTPATREAQPPGEKLIRQARLDLNACMVFWGIIFADVEEHLPEHLRCYLPAILEALAEVLCEGVDDTTEQRRRLYRHMRQFYRLLGDIGGRA
jgi:hypothetical protein